MGSSSSYSQPTPPGQILYNQLFRRGSGGRRRRDLLYGTIEEGLTPGALFDSAEWNRTRDFFQPFADELAANPFLNRAIAMTSSPFPLESEAISLVGDTLSGAFLPFSGARANPALEAFLDATRRNAREASGLSRERFLGTASGVLGGLSGAGSALDVLNQFDRSIQQEESDAVNRIVFDLFNAERDRMQGAAALAPELGALPFKRTLSGFELSDLPREEQLRFLDLALKLYQQRQELALRQLGIFSGVPAIPAAPVGLGESPTEQLLASLLNAGAAGIQSGQNPNYPGTPPFNPNADQGGSTGSSDLDWFFNLFDPTTWGGD